MDNQTKFDNMLKKLSFLIIISTGTLALQAQTPADTTKYWTINGNSSLNFSQVSLTNWAEGGDGSVSGTFLFNINANKKKNKHIWDNSFDVQYGLVKNASESLRKSVDKLSFSSKYGYKINGKWYLSALYDFRTQLAKGYNYPNKATYISNFMAPGYMNFALGFDYKPSDNFSAFLSPISTKFTFLADDSLSTVGAFGVSPGDKFRAEFGAYVKLAYTQEDLLKNVDLETKLDLFSNYLDKPQNIDVNWDVRFNMQVNKYLTANFGTTLKYDDNIKYVDSSGVEHGPRVQLKQLLGVGLTYNF
ncbi:Protein of unknown function (DUF3078) [Prolixibacter denitrificans]|uniref:DUF3078 family protein n=2 Tax=Prolixibacter denitrificans TaxID=1541063 RepID=A0A2P8CFR8_9BACT|nr:Protein of unknown function (DUF3078) [Prolixibacter denitrificans]GET23338.1 hypothetical protein JCM18694_35840 [Prolixibacter denitrificans]